MTETGFDSAEAAAEAWNTWPGRYAMVTPADFMDVATSVTHESPLTAGKYVPPTGDALFGAIQMTPNGAFLSPWPKLPGNYKAQFWGSSQAPLGLSDIYALRARWLALGDSIWGIRQQLLNCLTQNAQTQHLLNALLSEWNEVLKPTGLPLFGKNDIRGVNLAGLDCSAEGVGPYNFSNLDLSYGDLSASCLIGCRFYNCTMLGVFSHHTDFSGCECSGTKFDFAVMSRSSFRRSILAMATFAGAKCRDCAFDGAVLHSANMQGATLDLSSFGPSLCLDSGQIKQVFADLTEVKWNAESSFLNVNTSDVDSSRNPALVNHIQNQQFVTDVQRRAKSVAAQTAVAVWRLTSDCGRSVGRWLLSSVVCILAFAAVYAWLDYMHMFDVSERITRLFGLEFLYFSVVTFSTLGFGDITPTNPVTMGFVIVEVLLGYCMLAGLVTFFTNWLRGRR